VSLDVKILREILQLRAEGFEDQKIAEKLNIYGTEIINQEVDVFEEIEDLIEEGITDLSEIAKKLQLPQSYIQIAASDFGLHITGTTEEPIQEEKLIETTKQEKKRIRKYQLPKKTEQTKAKTTITKPAESRTTRDKKRGRPKAEPIRKLEIDKLAKKGAGLQEMIDASELTTELGVKQYLIRTNQYKDWKAKQEKQRKNSLGNLVYSVIIENYLQADKIEQEVYWKVDEFFTTTRSQVTYDTIKKIFTRYFGAKEAGKKISLSQLGKGSGLWDSEIGRILNKVGLEPLYGKKERHVTPQWKKDAIKRAFPLDVNPPDISYFLEIREHIVYQNMKKIGPRPKRQEFIAQPLANTGLPDLTYRLASQIYEARDLKFKTQDIVELLDTNKRVVNYILKNENIISPKIIEILQTLYPNKKITTPYMKAEKN